MEVVSPIISASILNADFSCLRDQIQEVENAGVDWLHLDIMDGNFVPNISMGPFIVETCKKISSLPLDTHLMIANPDKYIEQFAQAGSSMISVHIENNPQINQMLNKIRNLNCKAGIVLNPGTPAERIRSVIDLVDLILVMTVNPGFGGQTFIQNQLKKILKIKQMIEKIDNKPVLEVDGGLSTQTLPNAYHSGANVFVIGSAIFSNKNGIYKSVEELRSCLK